MRKTALIAKLLFVVLGCTFALTAVVSAQKETPLNKFAEQALSAEDQVQLSPVVMKHLKIPANADRTFCRSKDVSSSAGNLKWTVLARKRPDSSRVDIIVLELVGKDLADKIEKTGKMRYKKHKAKFWLTSQKGDLDGTCHVVGGQKPRSLPSKEAKAKFQEILKDLKGWEQNYK